MVKQKANAKRISPREKPKSPFNSSSSSSSSSSFLLFLGICFHLACLASIFDIYFTSPLTTGMDPVAVDLKAPAKRLVLFVGDGLRADKIYSLNEEGNPRAPFLHNIINNIGSWGVSHTRVPTESRPGHVAMIAGFYEDVSAVTKGWKENPVDFDHVFNRSTYTWGWGSPDIVPMFSYNKEYDIKHVTPFTYPSNVEDFGSSDAKSLDQWVFENVETFFTNASPELKEKLHSDKIVFFLHLLGIDTNGHAHRPFSSQYLENIEFVDKGVQRVTAFINDYYRDEETAFVFTSDHGMSDRGAHGGGHPEETETPLICWGAGVRKPDGNKDIEDTFGLFPRSNRKDINQADACPLMASLIGIEFPINSVGHLPYDHLDGDLEFKAHAIRANAIQILRSVQVAEIIKRNSSIFFKEFPLLTDHEQIQIVDLINETIAKGDFAQSIDISNGLIESCLKALRYYQTYDRYFLQTVMVLSYCGWLLLLSFFIVYTYSPVSHSHTTVQRAKYSPLLILFTGMLVFSFCLLYYSHQGWRYYMYTTFSIVFWCIVTTQRFILYDIISHVRHYKLTLYVFGQLCYYLFGLEALVCVFFDRRLLGGLLIFVALTVWPDAVSSKISGYLQLCFLWTSLCLVLAIFPLIPVEKETNATMVAGAAVLLAFVAWKISLTSARTLGSKVFIHLQILFTLLAAYVHYSSTTSFNSQNGLPFQNMVFAWGSLAISFFQPFFLEQKPILRFVGTALSFAPPFFLLCMSYESVFYTVLFASMYCWIKIEEARFMSRTISSEVYDSQLKRRYSWDEVRIAFTFVFFLVYAFFGMGNIASVSSFDPSSCYRFITVFSPFIMGALMIWKVFIPLLIVSCAFHIVATHIVKVETKALFLVAVALSDVMAINFFFLVRDEGSWMDIGTSISHFVINSAVIVCLPIFNFLALLYIGKSPNESLKNK